MLKATGKGAGRHELADFDRLPVVGAGIDEDHSPRRCDERRQFGNELGHRERYNVRITFGGDCLGHKLAFSSIGVQRNTISDYEDSIGATRSFSSIHS